MRILSSFLLVLALVLAVVVGPQTRAWAWGPSLLALGLALLAAVPGIWRKDIALPKPGVIVLGALTTAWFAWRAWVSPVEDLAMADLLLLAGAAGSFLVVQTLANHAAAERVLAWGIALLLLASICVVAKQAGDPTFIPVFGSRPATLPSGFFGHYNDGANFLIGASFLVAGAALFGRHLTVTRIAWGLIAVAGLVAVYFTRSRGGILGVSVGAGVFAALALIGGKRRNAGWFGPALVAIPVIGILAGGFLIKGWTAAQELRFGAGMETVLDGTIRLYLLGIATSCVGLHPWAGGGSRSFSWECYRFWDPLEHGWNANRPELVHNEMMQAATDYGFVGFALLTGLIGLIVVLAILGLLFSEKSRARISGDAWRAGGIAALAGILVQSSFSFVFHLLPGILLLGICLGRISFNDIPTTPAASRLPSKSILTVMALVITTLALMKGWAGSRVTHVLWPTYFSKHPDTSKEGKITALTEAIRIWPQMMFYRDRAIICQQASSEKENTEYFLDQALEDFAEACARHPYDAMLTINRANSLSARGKDREAEEQYLKTIALQGGMESAFQGRFSYVAHLWRKGIKQLGASEIDEASKTFERGIEQIAEIQRRTPWVLGEPRSLNLQLGIHEGLGAARESTGDFKGAMEAYDIAAALPNGGRAHYRAGVLLGRMAVADWQARMPSKALASFLEAKRRVALASETPKDVTEAQRVEYLAYLERSIRFLEGAKVVPSTSGN